MLRDSSSPVPFEDRSGILDELVNWAHRTDRFLVQIIGGAGGTGKTRLGVELCRQLSTTSEEETPGWKAGFLKDKPPDGAIKSLASLSEARLVVVDYTESRREQVAALLRACISSDSTAPIRIVLLVRQPRSYIADDRTAAAWVNAVRPENDEAIDQLLDGAENSVLLLDVSPLKLKDRNHSSDEQCTYLLSPNSTTVSIPRSTCRETYTNSLCIVWLPTSMQSVINLISRQKQKCSSQFCITKPTIGDTVLKSRDSS